MIPSVKDAKLKPEELVRTTALAQVGTLSWKVITTPTQSRCSSLKYMSSICKTLLSMVP